MANLFGREWTREELLARVGDMGQLAGVKRYVLDDGPSRGVEAVDVWTGSGLAFTVVPGRGMDIHAAGYAGRSLCWPLAAPAPSAGGRPPQDATPARAAHTTRQTRRSLILPSRAPG